jgi:hypothetical protein
VAQRFSAAIQAAKTIPALAAEVHQRETAGKQKRHPAKPDGV